MEISEDLCDAARPGDVVTVTGVVKHINVGWVFRIYALSCCTGFSSEIGTKLRDWAGRGGLLLSGSIVLK